MTLVRIVGPIFIILAAGCAGTHRAPDGGPPGAGVAQESAPAADKPRIPAATGEPAPAKPAQPAPPIQSAPVAAPPAPSTGPAVAKPEAPAAKPPARISAPAEQTPKKEAAAPPAPKPAAPALDLASLEKRLKETGAIGVFTKLTLKNQVDELLGRFRAYYDGRFKTTLAQLRQPYDLLIMKVLSLLQDGDPSLARAVADSREAIWGVLSDPDKFKNL